MPTEGIDVLTALQAAAEAAGAEVGQCEAEANALDAQARELVARRGEALMELARHFLPEISRAAIQANFEGIRGDLTAILARKEARQKELRAKLDAAEAETRLHNAEIDTVTRALDAKVAERERLEAEVANALSADADFQSRSTLAYQAEEQLHRNERRVAEVRKEEAEKLPRYDHSRLFRYLYERQYATPAYTSKGLIRALDRWVAKLIGYEAARVGYEFLKRTTDLVAAEVERRREPFQALMGQVQASQREAADKAGLTAVLNEGTELGARRDALVGALDLLKSQSQELQKLLADLDRGQNAFYAEAVERFRAFLGETRLALLERRARQTPEPDDDAIVAELAELDRRMDDVKPQRLALTGRRQTADHRRDALDQVVRQFRQANFDSSRSYFEDTFDPARARADFESGLFDAGTLWGRIRAAQRFRPHWVESAAGQAAQVAMSPAGRVILGAFVNAAGTAMQNAAVRGVRRAESPGFAAPSAPASAPAPASYSAPDPPSFSVPTFSEGSFTSGEGF